MLAWANKALPPHWPKLAALAVLALGLRLGYLLQASDSPFFDTPIVDARSYAEYARELAAGTWAGRPMPFWQAPFYPYFLAVLFSFFGENYDLPRLLQAPSRHGHLPNRLQARPRGLFADGGLGGRLRSGAVRPLPLL